MDFLCFTLFGQLQSWGGPAPGELRPTGATPSRSGVIGLLAAALGLERRDTEKQQVLSDSLGFAVRVDSSGVPIRDFHTVQAGVPARGRKFYTRKQELGARQRGGSLSTIVTQRDYLQDACFSVFLWANEDIELNDLKDALQHPKFPLFLGRKSCPLALPILAKILAFRDLHEAFLQYSLSEPEAAFFKTGSGPGRPGQTCEIMWEGEWPSLTPFSVGFAWDKCVDTKRRQFQRRKVYHGNVELPKEKLDVLE